MSSDSPPPDYYEPEVFWFYCDDCGKKTDHGSDLEDICVDCAAPKKRISEALERVMTVLNRHDEHITAVFNEMGSSDSGYESLKSALEELGYEVEYWIKGSVG